MTPSEIIDKDAERLGYDAEIVKRKIAKVLKLGAGILLRSNNSLLLLLALNAEDAELHLYSADTPLTMAKSLKDFIQKIRASNLKRVYGSGDIPQVLALLKKFGVDVQESNLPNYRWMATV